MPTIDECLRILRMFRTRKRDMPSLLILREDFFIQEDKDREALDHLIKEGVLKVAHTEKGKRFVGWSEPLESLREKFPKYAQEIRT